MVVKIKEMREKKERERKRGGGISRLTHRKRERENRGGEEREGGVTRGST